MKCYCYDIWNDNQIFVELDNKHDASSTGVIHSQIFMIFKICTAQGYKRNMLCREVKELSFVTSVLFV